MDSSRPLILSEDFYEWQADILKMMNDNKEDRSINIMYGSGGWGKSTFLKAILYEEPDRFLIIKSLRFGDFISSILEARRCEWDGDSIIFNVSGEEEMSQQTREFIEDEFFMPSVCNIWIFTQEMLDLEDIPIYGMERGFSYALRRISSEEAREIYDR